MKIYISGPMSGIRHLNFPAFESAENRLLEMGWEVVSPHRATKMDRWEEYIWSVYARHSIYKG